jgi:molybdopterin synthase catalytic subunit
MNVRVLFFGLLKDVFHHDSQSMELPAGSTVADLLRTCRQQAPAQNAVWSSVAVAVNQEYAGLADPLTEGDEIALLPPVSGGSDNGSPKRLIAIPATLTRDAIDREAVVDALRAGEDGALVVFDGVVRNNTRGRRTLYLDYTAYETMALLEMNRLVEEARQKFSVREIALKHRLGRIEIGETSVLIVVASAHRGAAFEACRWMIDSLKKTVPIWKKEYFEDGAVWSDGEPFPDELRQDSRAAVTSRPASKKDIL